MRYDIFLKLQLNCKANREYKIIIRYLVPSKSTSRNLKTGLESTDFTMDADDLYSIARDSTSARMEEAILEEMATEL